jgi:RecA-family ATPase
MPLVDQVSQLTQYIAEHDIGFVVVDSVVAACNAEAESSDTARQFFNALRKLRVPVLCISHTTKEGDRSHKPFGSTFWNNLPRNTWEMIKVQETEADTVSIALYNRKVNGGRLHRPIGYIMEFGENTICYTANDIMSESEFAKKASNKDRVHALLRDGQPRQAPVIATELGIPPDAVRQVFSRDKNTRFTHLESGWALLPNEAT